MSVRSQLHTRSHPKWMIGFSLIVLLLCGDGMAKSPEYHDIYLTEDRVCKACTWQWVKRDEIRLINRQGHATVVKSDEIMGVNNHPVWRKLFMSSLHGVGLPGPIIVPAAFQDANEYVCQYCDMFGK